MLDPQHGNATKQLTHKWSETSPNVMHLVQEAGVQKSEIPSHIAALHHPRAQALNVTYPMTTQEMAVPKKAYVKMDPKF